MSEDESQTITSAVSDEASEGSAQQRITAAELAASGALDGLFEQIDAGTIQLSGDGGLIPELIKGVLERGLQAEMSAHLGYEKGDPEAKLHPNARNGTSSNTV